MGTKNKPGEYDCLAKVDPNEPIFVLRAKDRLAPVLVRLWAQLALLCGCKLKKCSEAVDCARDMDDWARRHGGSKFPD